MLLEDLNLCNWRHVLGDAPVGVFQLFWEINGGRARRRRARLHLHPPLPYMGPSVSLLFGIPVRSALRKLFLK